jgi:hypothetical protein
MKIHRSTACLLAVSLLGVGLALPASSAFGAHAAKHKTKAPLLKSLTYTPLTTNGPDGFLQARYTATIKLYHSAPSITFTIDSTSSHNFETEAGPEKSYSAGMHKVSFLYDALPGGTYQITLYARVRPSANSDTLAPPAPLKSSDPATLVVAEAPQGQDGAGKVTKI